MSDCVISRGGFTASSRRCPFTSLLINVNLRFFRKMDQAGPPLRMSRTQRDIVVFGQLHYPNSPFELTDYSQSQRCPAQRCRIDYLTPVGDSGDHPEKRLTFGGVAAPVERHDSEPFGPTGEAEKETSAEALADPSARRTPMSHA